VQPTASALAVLALPTLRMVKLALHQELNLAVTMVMPVFALVELAQLTANAK
jgi:hypothetical protein